MNLKKQIISIFIILLSSIGWSGSHPNIFLNQDEINTIIANKDLYPWETAYDKTISAANSALSQKPLSVTTSGGTSHDYFTMQPYDWSNNMPSPCGSTACDGQINPLADRADYSTTVTFCNTVRDLGLGYVLTNDSKYADKAIALINYWCLDSATYMTPKFWSLQGIEQFITFPAMFYGADLIYNYAGWNTTEKQNFLKWVYDFASDVSNYSYANNWENWRQVFIASAGILTDNNSLADYAFNEFKNNITSYISSSGQMPQELWRTLTLDYSTFALLSITELAEIARHQNVDLYSYSSSGSSLEKAWDYHAPYIIDPSKWPYQQISEYKGENSELYELAYRVIQKPKYLDVVVNSRPKKDRYIMGYITLTHSTDLDYNIIYTTPVINPSGGEFSIKKSISLRSVVGAKIYYTTNGSIPDSTSTLYEKSFIINQTVDIQVIAFKDGKKSSIAKASFVNKDQVTIEAENMTLTGYIIDNGAELQGKGITIDSSLNSGMATTTFNGPDGIYSIILTVIPENDGRPTATLYVNDNEILNVTYSEDSSYSMLKVRETFTVEDITLQKGDKITISGTYAPSSPDSPEQGIAYARIDKIDLIPSSIFTSDNKSLTLDAENDIVLIPNPMTDKVILMLDNPLINWYGISILTIYNLYGQVVNQTEQYLNKDIHVWSWNGTNFNGESVKPGIYFYKITIGQNEYAGRIIKTK